MQTNRLNLRNVVVIAISLATMTMFTSCEKGDTQAEKLLVGKWVTSDYHVGDNDTIVFKENFVVEKYFDYFDNEEVSFLITYSLTGRKITFISNQEDLTNGGIVYIPYSETFEYILKGNSLTIKGFSNPFSYTLDIKKDVRFKKIKRQS